jgi:hypothetical protein
LWTEGRQVGYATTPMQRAQRNDHMAKPPSGVVGLCQSANRFDGGEIETMTVELTKKAKENLQRIAESRKKDSKFVRLEPGEKTTLHFDPEKIEPVDVEFEGKKSIRYQYTVADPNEPEKPKYFTVSKRNSALIDTHLAQT